MSIEIENAQAPAAVESSNNNALNQKILKQVEFYFGDANLPRDAFLSAEVSKNDGWVAINLIASFQRMKNLTTDLSMVVEALCGSPELLEVSDDRSSVRRKIPIADQPERLSRTLYVGGFPVSLTLEELEMFFSAHTKPQMISMRRAANQEFKGSVFLLLGSEEEAKALKESGLAYESSSLKVLSKIDYLSTKKVSKNADKSAVDVKAEDVVFTANTILRLTGLPESFRIMALRSTIKEAGFDVKFVMHEEGTDNYLILFREPIAADVKKYFDELTPEGFVYENSKVSIAIVEDENDGAVCAKMLAPKAIPAPAGKNQYGKRGRQFNSNNRKPKKTNAA